MSTNGLSNFVEIKEILEQLIVHRTTIEKAYKDIVYFACQMSEVERNAYKTWKKASKNNDGYELSKEEDEALNVYFNCECDI